MKFYIVKGTVTDPEAWHGAAKVGDDEWQFSDGLAGARSVSYDFLSLEAGLREITDRHPGCSFEWDNLNV